MRRDRFEDTGIVCPFFKSLGGCLAKVPGDVCAGKDPVRGLGQNHVHRMSGLVEYGLNLVKRKGLGTSLTGRNQFAGDDSDRKTVSARLLSPGDHLHACITPEFAFPRVDVNVKVTDCPFVGDVYHLKGPYRQIPHRRIGDFGKFNPEDRPSCL